MAQVDILSPVPAAFDPLARVGDPLARAGMETLRREYREAPPSAAPAVTLIVPNMVPKSAWGRNLRSILTDAEWQAISRKTRDDAHGVCSGCRCHGAPLEAHEDWHYNDRARRFTLKNVVPLCSDCHGVVHFGRSVAHGRGDEAFRHLVKVNEWSPEFAMEYVRTAFKTWADRSEHPWTGDYRWVEREHGLDVTDAGRLRAAAENRRLIRTFGEAGVDFPDYAAAQAHAPRTEIVAPERPREGETRRNRVAAR